MSWLSADAEMTKKTVAGEEARDSAGALSDAFREALAKLEAFPRLRGDQRAQRLGELWGRVKNAGLENDPGMRRIWYEIQAWELVPARTEPGPDRRTRPMSTVVTESAPDEAEQPDKHQKERWQPRFKLEDGSEYPDRVRLREEPAFFVYLASRVSATTSPVHRATYADILWEMQGGYKYALIAARAYLDSLPVLPFASERPDRYDVALRALQLALKLRNQALLTDAKQALFDELELSKKEEYTVPQSLELAYRLLQMPKERVEHAEIERGRRYLEAAAACYRDKGGTWPFHAFRALMLAAKFARRLGDSDGEWQALLSAGDVIEEQAAEAEAQGSSIVTAGFLEHAVKHYADIGASDRLERVKLRLRQAYEAAQPKFKPIALSVPIDMQADDTYAEKLVAMAPAESLAAFLSRLNKRIPSKDEVRALVEQFPLQRLFPRANVKDSRRIAESVTEEEKSYAALCDCYGVQASVLGLLLARLYRRLADAGRWTADSIVDFLASGVAFDEDKLPLLRTGVERYFARDYISAIHVLVPQIEDILRRLLGKMGLPTTSFDSKTRATREKPLGEVLEVQQLKEGLGEDLWFYLKFLFTEQLGENLRNDIAHGLLGEGRAREPLATLVVDALLTLRTLSISPAVEVAQEEEGARSMLSVVRDTTAAPATESPDEQSRIEQMPSAAWIRVMTDRIVHEFHPLKVILFGSHARGGARPDSDIDLLVVFPAVEDKRQQAVEIGKALADLPVAKDIIVTDLEEIGRRRGQISDVFYDALREGRVLFDRE